MLKASTPCAGKRGARPGSCHVRIILAGSLTLLAHSAAVLAQSASGPADATQSVARTTPVARTITQPASDQPESEQLESVVVTGTRIARGGFEAPTPVSVVGAERAQELANTNIGDLLNQLPAFRPTNTPASTGLGAAANYVGGRILDLRGMGAVRTLVLVDGKRFTPSTTQATVDTNMIPLSLLDRAEVVTGGASAAYGSDAVAGVVNFVLNQKLDGIRSSLEYGVSSRGDNKTATGSLAGGTTLFSGRGHFIGAFEFEDDRGVGDCEVRLWCSEGWLNFGNAPAGSHGLPANNILPNVNPSTISPTGVINSPAALHGITFNPDGTPRPFVYGSLVNSLYMVGGEGHGQDGYFQGLPIVAPNQRYLAYTRTNYNFTDDLQGALDVSFGHLLAHGDGTQYRSVALPIQRTNPFIPGSTNPALDIPTILANNPGITSFNLGRNFADIGNPLLRSTNNLLRAVFSLKGKIAGSWTWDAYYQYGHNKFELDADNDVINANIASAIDAVRNAGGQIVCRANQVSVTKPGCVPLNPFGNQVSAAAHAYVTGTSVQTDLTTEHVVAANVQGEPFSTWAGPVSLAGGVEYRSDKIDGGADPISRNLGFFVNNAANINGKVNVSEGYAESLVPLLKDLPLAHNVDFNGAVRRTHYDRSSPAAGSSAVSTTTWKLGLTWQLIDSFRIRGTRSRDIRAPNVSELYGPNTTGFGILNDPARGGLQTNPVVRSGSNGQLVPEVADTWTAGFVVQPAADGWLGRLQMSADYYNIDLKNVIASLGAQTIATRCYQGATEFCSLITRDATGVITQISDVLQNVNRQITRGVDLELAYRQPMGRFGSTDFRLLANYVGNLITIDSAGAVDRAGQTGLRGGTIPGMPRYTLDGFINWADRGFNTSLHTRFIPDGIYNAAFIGPDQPGYSITNPASSNNNHVKSALYLDLITQYEFSGRGDRSAFTVYAGVDNLTNVDPPRVPGANGTGNSVLFDPVGRMWKVGVRYRR
jgi:outer membrane receptor protein involved in Fe transport